MRKTMLWPPTINRKSFLVGLLWISIILWAALLLKLAVLRAHPVALPASYNLVPLKSIAQYTRGYPRNDTIRVINLYGNIGVFMPFGLITPVLRRKWSGFKTAFLVSAAFSLLLETLQFITGQGVADIDDLLLNVSGGLLGYGLYCLVVWAGNHGRGNEM